MILHHDNLHPKSSPLTHRPEQEQQAGSAPMQLADRRKEAAAGERWNSLAGNSPRVTQLKAAQQMIRSSPLSNQTRPWQPEAGVIQGVFEVGKDRYTAANANAFANDPDFVAEMRALKLNAHQNTIVHLLTELAREGGDLQKEEQSEASKKYDMERVLRHFDSWSEVMRYFAAFFGEYEAGQYTFGNFQHALQGAKTLTSGYHAEYQDLLPTLVQTYRNADLEIDFSGGKINGEDLLEIHDDSGHYQTAVVQTLTFLEYLQSKGVKLENVKVKMYGFGMTTALSLPGKTEQRKYPHRKYGRSRTRGNAWRILYQGYRE